MNRDKQFEITLLEVKTRRDYKESDSVEPRYVDAEFDTNPHSFIGEQISKFLISSATSEHKKWIQKNGFEICLKKDATASLTVGKKSESGCFVLKQHKTYWLKPK